MDQITFRFNLGVNTKDLIKTYNFSFVLILISISGFLAQEVEVDGPVEVTWLRAGTSTTSEKHPYGRGYFTVTAGGRTPLATPKTLINYLIPETQRSALARQPKRRYATTSERETRPSRRYWQLGKHEDNEPGTLGAWPGKTSSYLVIQIESIINQITKDSNNYPHSDDLEKKLLFMKFLCASRSVLQKKTTR